MHALLEPCIELSPSTLVEKPQVTLLAVIPAVNRTRMLLISGSVILHARPVSAYHIVASEAVDPNFRYDDRSSSPIRDP